VPPLANGIILPLSKNSWLGLTLEEERTPSALMHLDEMVASLSRGIERERERDAEMVLYVWSRLCIKAEGWKDVEGAALDA